VKYRVGVEKVHFPQNSPNLGDRECLGKLRKSQRVKFTNQELDEKAFLTAQVEGNKVVYSIILTNAKNPLSREEVETHFEGELSKLSPKSN
jgi:hypothetical protein